MTAVTASVLLELGPLGIRQDNERAAAVLRDVLQGLDPSSSEVVDDLARLVLQVCADQGPGALAKGEALKLLFPLLRHLSNESRVAEFNSELRGVALRDDLRTSDFLRPFLKDVEPLVMEADRREGDVSGLAADESWLNALSAGNPPALADAADRIPQMLVYTADAWSNRRGSVDIAVRFASDAWLVRAALLVPPPFPTAFAEALYFDEEFWASDEGRRLAEGRPHPFTPVEVGVAAAALLNSGLRRARPRLFLRAPESLVAEPIGQKMDIASVEEHVVDEVALPLLRAVTTIAEENGREGARRPRKGVFRELGEHLEQVLDALGCEIDGRPGEFTRFDPERYAAAGVVLAGDKVSILVPGLRNRRTGTIRMKAVVTAAEGSAQESEGNND